MFGLLPGPAHCVYQVRLRHLLAVREIAGGDLGVDFYARVGWDEVVCSERKLSITEVGKVGVIIQARKTKPTKDVNQMK